MGWDYTHAIHYTAKGAIDRKAEIDDHYNWSSEKTEVALVKSCMVGSTYYAALRVTDKETGNIEIVGEVVLTHTDSREYFNFGMKAMSETMGPTEDKCPASILKLLSPTDSEWANDWRERCRKRIEEKKNPHTLSNLPIGAVIRFTQRSGKVIELLKHPAAYQFKRPFWYNSNDNTYMPATRIPDSYEVVNA